MKKKSIPIHDFKFYKYGAIAVDGGHEYLRKCEKELFEMEEY